MCVVQCAHIIRRNPDPWWTNPHLIMCTPEQGHMSDAYTLAVHRVVKLRHLTISRNGKITRVLLVLQDNCNRNVL